MALPTSQPVPEILRGWTVSGGIPAGNDVTGRIVRHRIPPRESIAEGSQEMARMEQATLQGTVRILDSPGICGAAWTGLSH